ncbi:carboxypeptidase regulatory-like domain-containing protein [Paenibacillus chartarius]|uniref:Carboxypeptidase regulatory-like domain-containing protein n=1 Tax=Paenibacillus chartarius TaxID=747481 RepID=A0ABV6DGM4_9BACL
MQRTRKTSAVIVWLLLLNLIASAVIPPASASPTAVSFDSTRLGLNVAGEVDAVLGRTFMMNVTLSNTDASAWAYNAGVELVLGDGLSLAGTNAAAPTTNTVSASTYKQTVFWQDIKDLAPGETYTFAVTLQQNSTKREKDENQEALPVQFGDKLPVDVRVYAGSVARDLYYNPSAPTKSASTVVNVTPYQITLSAVGKHVKGAGDTSASGDNWDDVNYTVTIVNNNLYASEFIGLKNTMPGELESPHYSSGAPTGPVTGSTYRAQLDGSGNVTGAVYERVQQWNTVNLAAGAEYKIEYKTAIFDKMQTELGENAGSQIKDGTSLTSTISFDQVVVHQAADAIYGGRSIPYSVVAKDMIVSKTVSGTVGYGNTLTYTIAVKTNQYYNVDNVVVADTVGDGQTFHQYITTPAGATITKPSPGKNADGTTSLGWRLGTVQAETLVTLQYTTKVDTTWGNPASPYTSNGVPNPIVAGDTLSGSVTVTGDTYVSGPVSDSSGVTMGTNEPTITGIIAAVDGQAPADPKLATVAVGQSIDFRITYNAAGVPVNQRNVQIYDYLPIGTKPKDLNGNGTIDSADLSAYGLNGVTPQYDAASNALYWDLQSDDVNANSTFTTTIHAVVWDDATNVAMDKAAQNLVKLSFASTLGKVKSVRDTMALTYVEPQLTMSRTVSKTTVDGGDEVTETVVLTNTGTSTAYRVAFTEAIPPELDPDSIVTVSGPAGMTYTAAGANPVFGGFSIAPNGGQAVITYKIKVKSPAGAGRDISQSSSWTYHSSAAEPGDRTYNGAETLKKQMTVNKGAIKATAIDAASGNVNQVRIGEWVVYQIEVTVPSNDVTYEAALTATLHNNQSPATNNGVPIVFSAYDGTGTGTGTALAEGEEASLTGKQVKIAKVPLRTGTYTYVYYVKAIVNQVSSGNSESQGITAKFDWKDAASGGVGRSISDSTGKVDVMKPNLTASIAPASVPMAQNDSASFTMTITNNGKSSAYDFAPSVTIPAGFSFTSGGGTVTVTDETYTMTFAPVGELPHTGSNSVSYPFSIQLDAVKGSGSTQSITGSSGAYYTTHGAYQRDTDGDAGNNPTAFEKLTPAAGSATVTLPAVLLTNSIKATTSGSLTAIAPGDVVTYELVLTVPKGTTAYQVKVTDTFDQILKFDVVSAPSAAAISGSIMTINYGTLDATAAPVTITETIQLRAKTNGSSPTSGAIQALNEAFKSTAKADWSTQDSGGTVKSTANAVTTVNVRQPSLVFDVLPIVTSEFSSGNRSIPVTLKLDNGTGQSAAVDAAFRADLPPGITASNVSDGGVYDASARTITWSGITVGAGLAKTVTFQASLEPGVLGAGVTQLKVQGTLLSYKSTPGTAGSQQAKLYTPNAADEVVLSVAPAALSAAITDSSNGGSRTAVRPGDTVTYKLTIQVPAGAVAYNAVLSKVSSWTEADVQSVTYGGTPIAAVGSVFPLGNITGTKEFVVTARVKTETNVTPKPYQAVYTPSVTYEEASSNGTVHDLTTAPLSIGVVEPSVGLTLTEQNGKTGFSQAGEQLTYTARLNNTGLSTAYDPAVTFTLPGWVSIVSIGAASGTTKMTGSGFVWSPDDLENGLQDAISFTVQAEPGTAANTQADIQAVLQPYYSLNDTEGKTYGPAAANQPATILSAVTVTGADSRSTTAGRDVVYDHTVTNNGAGRDTYTLSWSAPFASDIYVDNVLAGGGPVSVTLNGGESRNVKLVVHVPESAPYDNGIAHVLQLTAANGGGQSQSAQDQLTVTGTPLNGWTSATAEAAWEKPAYKPGEAVKWRAVSAVNAASVKVVYAYDGGSGEAVMELTNAGTYVQDGFKTWAVVLRLPDDIPLGDYGVTFKSLSAPDALLESESLATAVRGTNNAFAIVNIITLSGTVTDAARGTPVAGATVVLTDLSGHTELGRKTADGSGYYDFGPIPAGSYVIAASAAGYGTTTHTVDAKPAPAAVTRVTADLQLSAYRLTLTVSPSSIVGDGKSAAELIAAVTDSAYRPVEGVTVSFDAPVGAPNGTFPLGKTGVTDSQGRAVIRYQSTAMEDVRTVRIPVTATVVDAAHGLNASGSLVLTFEPGAVEGVVTELGSDGIRRSVAGAAVGIRKDFDGDGAIDFSASAVTGADGSYRIGVPRGNVSYALTVDQAVTVNGQDSTKTFLQQANAGVIDGQSDRSYLSSRSLSGIVVMHGSDGADTWWPAGMLSHMRVYLRNVDTNTDVLDGSGNRRAFAVGTDSVFNAVDLPAARYGVTLAYEVESGKELALVRIPAVDLTGAGEIQLVRLTVNPYSLVYDANTGVPLVGSGQDQAHVALYIADTPRNALQGLQAGTLAALPASRDAAVQKDGNPQDVDGYGHYAFYVLPNTDYYVQVSRPGYLTYTSGTLQVDGDMLRFDVPMLGGSGERTVTAGKSAAFTHTLTNSRGEPQQYKVEVDSPYPLVLSSGTTSIASGHPAGSGGWIWDTIAPEYAAGGGSDVTLPIGVKQGLNLDLLVTVPLGTPPTTVASSVYMTVYSAQDQYSWTDSIHVVEAPLDGWTGQMDAADWKEPVVTAGDGLILAARSTVNAVKLTASYVWGNAGKTETVELTLSNADTFIADGFKSWKALGHYVPIGAGSGEYFVTFTALDGHGTALQGDGEGGPRAGNNRFTVRNQIDLDGTVTDRDTGLPIAGSTVALWDSIGLREWGSVMTDANGYYRFEGVKPKVYLITVRHDGYSTASRMIDALPASPSVTKITADFELVQFTIKLTANPTSIIGDGKSSSVLTTVILDKNGLPIAGVPVTFSAARGTFPNGANAVTDANGTANVRYQSSRIEGVMSQRIPVVATVNDPEHKLYAEAQIIMTFEPAAIAGIVTTMVNGVPVPVEGAIVTVEKDFDGDGVIDFSAQMITGPDGKYSIAIPRGNVQYDLLIQKPMTIGGEVKYITFRQKAEAGDITGLGDQFFDSKKTATGLVTISTTDHKVIQFQPAVYQKMKVYLKDKDGKYLLDLQGNRQAFPLDANGVFTAQDVPAGEYQMEVVAEVEGGEIIVNRQRNGSLPKLVVQQNGEMNIGESLIDPYGIVTDADDGSIIAGARVELYYADTARNSAAKRVPHTLVNLPELIGFPPNDNHNPQNTDAAGSYATMVFPYTDYYLRVTKAGYQDYTSETIPVETDIVRKDVQLRRIPAPKPGGGGGGGGLIILPVEEPPEASDSDLDLAVSVSTDKAMYEEGSVITYTIRYMNRSPHTAHDAELAGDIPGITEIEDAAGGKITGARIVWTLGELKAGQSGTLVYKVRIPALGLTAPTVMVRNDVLIRTKDRVVHAEDDKSSINVMMFTNRFGPGSHRGYILGYPDGTFKRERGVTRAEVAAIFARILDLKSTVQGVTYYNDVERSFWAADYIEAVTRKGLFQGYEGGLFRPNDAITRAELATVLTRYLNLEGASSFEVHFADIVGHWAEQAIEQMHRYHIIDGYEDGTFRPSQTINRAETVAMINRLLYRGPLYGQPQAFPDMGEDDWAYGHVQESTSSHRYERNPDGSERFVEDLGEVIW